MAGVPQSNPQGFPQLQSPIADTTTGYITTAWYYLLQTLWQRTGAGTGGTISPTGVVAPFAASVPPGGWLVCDGSAVSRAGYANLFSVIGTTWGAGNGSSTFNLPDLRGRTALGANGSHALASTGGAETVTISTAQLPSHTHPITDPGHFHASVIADASNTGGTTAHTAATAGNTASAMTGITATDATGSGNPVTTISPYATLVWIIKT